jgi:hypothetical protein
MVALRSDNSPKNRPATMATTKVLTVASVVAIRNGGLFSSENGVSDMMRNSNAGSETYSRKKFIQARPDSGSPLVLPQAKPMKIRPK